MNGNTLEWIDGVFLVNDEPTTLDYASYVSDDDYEYDKGLVQYLTEQIRFSNNVLITFVSVSSLMFAVMIILLRRSMRWQMLHRKKTHHKGGENDP